MADWIRASDAITFDNRPTNVNLYAPFLRLVLNCKSSRNVRDVTLRELMLDSKSDTPTRLGGGFILGRGLDSGRAPKELSSRVISRQHIQLLVDKTGDVFLVDLDSTHGTTVRRGTENLKVHSKQPIRLLNGDLVTIGRPVVSGNLHDAVRFKVAFRHGAPEKSSKTACPYMASFFASYRDLPAIDAALHPKPAALVANVTGRYGLERSALYESEPESALPRGGNSSPAKNTPQVINVVDDSSDGSSSSDDEDGIEHVSDARESSPPSSFDSQEDEEVVCKLDTTICVPSSIVEYESQDDAGQDEEDSNLAASAFEEHSDAPSKFPALTSSNKGKASEEGNDDDHEDMQPIETANEEEDLKSSKDVGSSSTKLATEVPSLSIKLPDLGSIRLPDLGPIRLPDLKQSIRLPDLRGISIPLPFPVPVLDLAGDSVPGDSEAGGWLENNTTSSELVNSDENEMLSYISEPPAAQPVPSKSDVDDEFESWLSGHHPRFSSEDAEDDYFASDFRDDDEEIDSANDWPSEDEDAVSEDEEDDDSEDEEESEEDDEEDGEHESESEGLDKEEVAFRNEDDQSELSDLQSVASEEEDLPAQPQDEDVSRFGVTVNFALDYDSDDDDDGQQSASDAASEDSDDEEQESDDESAASDAEPSKSSAVSNNLLDNLVRPPSPSAGLPLRPVTELSQYTGLESAVHSSYATPPAFSPFDGSIVARNSTRFDGLTPKATTAHDTCVSHATTNASKHELLHEAPNTPVFSTQTSQRKSSSALPPSPAHSIDGPQIEEAPQTPDKADVIHSVGLATPPTPVRQLEASTQTLTPSRKRSCSEMEAEDVQLVSLTTAANTATTSDKSASPERPPKRRFLERLGFTAGVVVGAAGMFGTLLMLGEE